MSLETWLWIIAGVIISEIIFILFYKYLGESEGWIPCKASGFLLGGVFTIFNAIIVFYNKWNCLGIETCSPKYINLLWVYSFVVGIGLLFLINYWIKNYIDKCKKKKKRGKKK